MKNETIIRNLTAIIEEADKMKSAYFFQPPTSAYARRSYERYHSHDVVSWTEGGHEYTAAYNVKCSCRNVYARGEYTKDGKKTTLTAIKNSLNRMMNA